MTALDGGRIEALFGKESPYTVEVYPVLSSTNETARLLGASGAPSGRVILAERQTAGRGRLGRSFYSPDGSGIYMSVLLRPRFPVEYASRITTFAAVAAARAVERVAGIDVSLKWVNDLFVGKRKLCGILAESALDADGGGLSYVVLGIGINVLHTALPEELSEIATSIEDACGRRIDRNELVGALLTELLPLLSGEIPDGYMDEYRARNLVLSREVTVVSGGECFSAFVKEIKDDGSLVVTLPDGSEKRIVAGDVSVRI